MIIYLIYQDLSDLKLSLIRSNYPVNLLNRIILQNNPQTKNIISTSKTILFRN